MSATYPTKLLLAFRSGDVCAFPGCPVMLTVEGERSDDSIIGEAAHIAGERPRAARYDPGMTPEERDHYDNLIYLCRNHHEQIDDQEQDYPVERLQRMKAGHEAMVRDAMNEAFAEIGFPELEAATEWLSRVPSPAASDDFALIPPEEKLKRNGLSDKVRVTVTMGLSVASEVHSFVVAEEKLDPGLPIRLKSGFLEEYYRLRRESLQGDDLFDLMCRFAQRGLEEQARRSAGLAVLMYLFERCDVFEQ